MVAVETCKGAQACRDREDQRFCDRRLDGVARFAGDQQPPPLVGDVGQAVEQGHQGIVVEVVALEVDSGGISSSVPWAFVVVGIAQGREQCPRAHRRSPDAHQDNLVRPFAEFVPGLFNP